MYSTSFGNSSIFCNKLCEAFNTKAISKYFITREILINGDEVLRPSTVHRVHRVHRIIEFLPEFYFISLINFLRTFIKFITNSFVFIISH